jgi:hypothetical protein
MVTRQLAGGFENARESLGFSLYQGGKAID